jgi:hypothetical protein
MLGVVAVGTEEPEQLPEECKGLDRDRPVRDTSTKRHLRSTTSRAGARASRDTSALHAKRRYRADESPRAKQVSAEQIQAVPQPTIQKAAEPKSVFSLLLVSSKDFLRERPVRVLGLSKIFYLLYWTLKH